MLFSFDTCMPRCLCSVYMHIEILLFLLYNTFTITQLTRDKLGVHQSSMRFQYEYRLQMMSQGWIVSFQRHVDRMQSRYSQRPCNS